MGEPANKLNSVMIEKYRNHFLREVEHNVERGEWSKMCMQCGVCTGSCPLGDAWTHSPQKLFMMIRAGKREEVLTSDSMWMCTSCYSCVVRCPRELPIRHIMHGLAHYADRLGLAPKQQPTRKFAKLFWNNLAQSGRINEAKLGVRLYFMNGLMVGIKTGWKMLPLGWAMVKAKRLNPLALVAHRGIKDKAGLQRMLAKAKQLEDERVNMNAIK